MKKKPLPYVNSRADLWWHKKLIEKKPNVLYHGIWAVIAFLLNNPLTGCSRQQQSFIWKQVVADSSNPFSLFYGNRLK